jgi:hypothetical protein
MPAPPPPLPSLFSYTANSFGQAFVRPPAPVSTNPVCACVYAAGHSPQKPELSPSLLLFIRLSFLYICSYAYYQNLGLNCERGCTIDRESHPAVGTVPTPCKASMRTGLRLEPSSHARMLSNGSVTPRTTSRTHTPNLLHFSTLLNASLTVQRAATTPRVSRATPRRSSPSRNRLRFAEATARSSFSRASRTTK